jgi:hypothetical protein
LALELSNAVKDINWTIQRKYNVEYMKLWNDYSLDKVLIAKISSISYLDPYVGNVVVQLSTSTFSHVLDNDLYTGGICEICNSKYYNGKYKILLAQDSGLIIDTQQFIYPDYLHVRIKPKSNVVITDVVRENILIYGQNLDTLREPSYHQHVANHNRVHDSLIHKRSIALHPNQLQPTGVLNFNVIKNKHLQLLFDEDFIEDLTINNDSLVVNIIGKSYNTCTLEKGYCKLMFGY